MRPVKRALLGSWLIWFFLVAGVIGVAVWLFYY
jgi:hypothetical protein